MPMRTAFLDSVAMLSVTKPRATAARVIAPPRGTTRVGSILDRLRAAGRTLAPLVGRTAERRRSHFPCRYPTASRRVAEREGTP